MDITFNTFDINIDVWYKLAHLKQDMKRINEKHFKGITIRLAAARDELQSVQNQLNDDLQNVYLTNKERNLLAQVEKWDAFEEKVWQQKTRVDWIKLGDSNTKFFHSYATERKNQNAIKTLIRELRMVLD